MLSKVITISQQKGGTGKTTLAVHLAMAFIKYHDLKVAIIDTDPQGSLGKWFMIRTEKKVSNENLTFKTASLWGAQYESKTLKNDHDIVIIDTPPKIESDARPSIEAADLVLIPMAASHVDFWATGAIVEIAKKAISKKTGARCLRSILETILLKTMFELPELENVLKVTIDKSAAKSETDPIVTYGKKQSTSVA